MKIASNKLIVMLTAMLMAAGLANAGTLYNKNIGQNSDEFVRVLRQASVELETSNSDLSRKLVEFADSKTAWNENMKERRDDFKETKSEVISQYIKDEQVLRNAATTLKADQKNDLSDQITGLADRLQIKTEEIKNLEAIN